MFTGKLLEKMVIDIMSKNKTSISKASSYEDIGAFWDTHDVTDYWDQTYPVKFEIDIQFSKTCFAVVRALVPRLLQTAKKRGISAETLLNLWVLEKLWEGEKPPISPRP